MSAPAPGWLLRQLQDGPREQAEWPKWLKTAYARALETAGGSDE